MNPLPLQGRLAGVDYGRVRIGVALCDVSQTWASPHQTFTRRDAPGDAAYFRRLAEQEDVAGFVVGLPIHGSGDESELSEETRRFAQWLEETTGLPVRLFDERYSSQQADSLMAGALSAKKRKQRRDMLAAQLILAAYLEAGADRDQKPRGLDD